jgi:hypothetical protein
MFYPGKELVSFRELGWNWTWGRPRSKPQSPQSYSSAQHTRQLLGQMSETIPTHHKTASNDHRDSNMNSSFLNYFPKTSTHKPFKNKQAQWVSEPCRGHVAKVSLGYKVGPWRHKDPEQCC